MKIGLLLATLCLFVPSYVQAAPEEGPEALNNPLEEMAEMAICAANEIVLMHHRFQVGSMITAQNNNNPQLTMLAESFNQLAKVSHQQIGTYVGVIKEAIIPQITSQSKMNEEEILLKASSMMKFAAVKIITVFDEARPEKQPALERELINKAAMCELLAATVKRRHTM